ncbi:MAG: CBS domain-containing protein [Candidatus Thiothrix singaporensis]|uniref:CBS domain-containing protein n=1 Tax=Candidatus Thiothrix singaporensis TaxID=2799669 RepID=A0A7L6AWU4_9GAMM|nr:MAG: CBS domain-containing protein [Candidatus Thiothrix singaporensis]
MTASDKDFACITDGGKVVGVVDLHSSHLDHEVPVQSLKKKRFVILRPGTTLTAAIAQFYQEKRDIALISRSGNADQDAVIGVISSKHLIDMIGDVTATLR